MRDLYIHVGLYKTGTTYLQRLILENRDLFLEAGLGLAPYLHPVEGNHYPLFRALRDEDFRRAAFERVFDEVAAAPGRKVLISAEEIGGHITMHPDRLAAMHDAAARHFVPHVVIFVRRQDFLRESLFVQSVKTWFAGNIDDNARSNSFSLDHNARVMGMEAVFGRENVHVALYKDERPNDLLGALLAALGIEIDRARLRPIPPQNVSLHRRQVLLMSQLPKAPDALLQRGQMKFTSRMAVALRGSDAIADDGQRFMMSPRARHDLVAAHRAGNQALVDRHGITDVGGFLDLPDPNAPWTPPAPITPAERAAALRAVLRAFWSKRRPLYALGSALRVGLIFARMARTRNQRRTTPADDPARGPA